MNILLFTDLHWNGPAEGFHQQPRWVGGWPTLAAKLTDLVRQHDANMVLSLGDLVEGGDTATIRTVTQALDTLPVPILYCLGNHDLAQPAALSAWQTFLGDHASRGKGGMADTFVETPELDIAALDNRYLDPEGLPALRWSLGTNPVPALIHGQLERLDAFLSRSPDKPAIVAMHCPLEALPSALTGLPAPIHAAPEAYRTQLGAVLDRHPRVRLVIGGHCHATCATAINTPAGKRTHMSLGAYGETPHQYAILTVAGGKITLQVHQLGQQPTAPALDESKRWALGRPEDRTLTL